MTYIGLLTDAQKRLGYFVSQDDDFIWLYHRNSGTPRVVTVWLYDICKIKDVREAAEKDIEKVLK